jgi:hypothetical protein
MDWPVGVVKELTVELPLYVTVAGVVAFESVKGADATLAPPKM